MTLTDPFKIRDHVADFAGISQRYSELSAQTLARRDNRLDLGYGELAAERLDLILPGSPTPGAPVHIFIHGGYWRAGSKAEYAYIAEPVVAAGGIAVLVDYALMPQSRMADLVAQVRRALAWVSSHIADYGGDPARVTASGHSAGAHLASYLASSAPGESGFTTDVKALLLVSGIYDLTPIPDSFLQPEIRLTPGEVRTWSPLDAQHTPDIERILLVGGDETAPFHAQAEALHRILPAGRSSLHSLPGLNHMSVILEMGDPNSAAGQMLAEVVSNS